MKRCLEAKYGNRISILYQGGNKSSIIKLTSNDLTIENDKLIAKAASLIKDEIALLDQSPFYPTSDQLTDSEFLESCLPKSLVSFLSFLIPAELKKTAIGHAIISASRKNLESPLLLGLWVELDHSFGSKWLNNHLSRSGFSVTNQEVRKFKESTLEQYDPVDHIPGDHFVQWSADNVDDKIGTLDGKIPSMAWAWLQSIHLK